jgi:RNA polymerase sigma factor (sigma-70 family)
MDDREIVAAIAAGDPAGLADAYDRYAESLYGYCRWMLSEPEDATGALQDTFVIAAARLGGLRDPRKLRPWLYAVARNECYRRLRAAEEAGLDEAAGTADPSAEAGASAEQAELRRLVRAALDGLNPGEREVVELGLRHDLQGADLAAVLGVPRNQAHALASRARGQLEKALGALLVARTGRRACPELDVLLDGWDGRLTGPLRKRVSRHIDQCDVCTDRRRGTLRPAALYGMAPLAALPRGLRAEVLELCADVSPLSQSYRRDVAQSAGPFRPSGFPESARPPRPRMLALAGIAAAAGVVIAIAATGIITVLALSGSHPPGAAAARSGSPSGTAGASVTTSAGSAGGAAPSLSPAASAPAVTSAPPPVAAPSASPVEAKPSPSATSSRPVSPTPAPSRPTPTPTPTTTPPSTATATPTSTATATATPSSTFTFPG